MLFDLDRIKDFITTLMWSKTSVIGEAPISLPQMKQVAEGALIYGQTYSEIKVYSCEDILFQNKTSLVAYSGNHICIVIDKAYFDKLMQSKFKSAFFGACAIQVARYILHHDNLTKPHPVDPFDSPPCLPSHKPEVAQFFYQRSKKQQLTGRKGSHPAPTSYANFIGQALLRGGFDLQEFEVDKKALGFYPIDDVLAAHAVDVEMNENLYIAAERVNRIRALNHYYERDLTKWDGCELQIDLL